MKKFTVAKVTVDFGTIPTSQVAVVILVFLAIFLGFSKTIGGIVIGSFLLYLSIIIFSKAKLLDGKCPYCETDIQAMSTWLGINCPACKQRIVIKGNKLYTLAD